MNKEKMNISVVVPVYNVEKYLLQCINSLIKQTYKPYEIIFVDDGSTDRSAKIIDDFVSKYDMMRVIHKKNAGLGYARNTGIDNAKGDWILFLDSDDFFSPNLIELLVNAQKKNSADLVVGGYERVDQNGNIIGQLKYDDMVYNNDSIKDNLLPRLLGSSPECSDSISMSSCNALFSMDIIKKNNILFLTERYVLSEDLFFNFDYYCHADKIVLISDTAYKYRATTGSLTKRYCENRYDLSKNLYKEMMVRIDDKLYPDIYKIRLMRSMFNYWRMCFQQENRNISKKSKLEQLKSISFICKDDLTQDIINNYPVNRLQFKQRVFLFLVKYDLNFIISIFVEHSKFI